MKKTLLTIVFTVIVTVLAMCALFCPKSPLCIKEKGKCPLSSLKCDKSLCAKSSCEVKAEATEEESCCGSCTKYNFTNADFYKEGKFDADLAKKAYKNMMKHFGVEVYGTLGTDEFWVTDFSLGDFANVGMGGIFWSNEQYPNVPGSKFEGTGFLGHEIYLLPGQMIVEHGHVETKKYPAKRESWLVRNGSCYSFSVQDDKEAFKTFPAFLPKSQVDSGFITCNSFKELKAGDRDVLNKEGYKHFLIAGPEGAIVTEFGNFHDNDGLRFTNPNTKF